MKVFLRPLLPLLYAVSSSLLLQCTSCKDAALTPPDDGALDTTSHNFSWQITQLGDGAGSVLYDVAIINDTLAYAVGEISVKDSQGNWINPPYNIARWNGSQWELMTIMSDARILFPGSIGDSLLFVYGKAIFAREPNDIWIAAGNIHHFDGVRWTQVRGEEAGFSNRIWGDDSGRLWCVGNNGTVINYNGSSWQKIESGTTLDIQDIYGAPDPKTGELVILAVGTRNYPIDRAILRIQNNSVSHISTHPIQYELFGVWFVPNQHFYVVGDGIYEKTALSDSTWKNNPLDITTYATTKIRGNALNDVFVVGAFGEILHYNFTSWKSYRSVTGLASGSYTSIAVNGDMVIAVGGNFDRAVVTIGERGLKQ